MLGLQKTLILGNLDAKRDWGYAPDYVEGMWKILQANEPEDFVLATSKTYSVRTFVENCFQYFGENIKWQGKGIDEVGILESQNKTVISIDKKYFRPTEVDLLLGDYSNAKNKLGWEPKTNFKELVKIMIEYDFNRIKNNNING